jgi:hypothetical protein
MRRRIAQQIQNLEWDRLSVEKFFFHVHFKNTRRITTNFPYQPFLACPSTVITLQMLDIGKLDEFNFIPIKRERPIGVERDSSDLHN